MLFLAISHFFTFFHILSLPYRLYSLSCQSLLPGCSHSLQPALIPFGLLSFPSACSHSPQLALIPFSLLSFPSACSHSLQPALTPFSLLSFPSAWSHSSRHFEQHVWFCPALTAHWWHLHSHCGGSKHFNITD